MKSNEKTMRIGKDISFVFLINLLNMFLNFFSSFVMPKELQIDSYAYIKTYQLFIGYAGIFHFGFVDGILLHYGGKDIEKINIDDVKTEVATFELFQFVITAGICIVAWALKNNVLLLFALSLIPYNVLMLLKTLFQATGSFKQYGAIINCSSIVVFILNLSMIYVFKIDNPVFYVLAQAVTYFFLWIFFKWKNGLFSKIHYIDFAVLKCRIFDGFSLMLGNLASVFMLGIDRWFIKGTMDNKAFALYSFAVSIENFFNLIITPLSLTFYNFFCRSDDAKQIKAIRDMIAIISCVMLLFFFPVKILVVIFLPQYEPAINVLLYLFVMQIVLIQIKTIYTNLYKARKQQHVYFKKMSIVLLIGVVLNLLVCMFVNQIEMYAVATLIMIILWHEMTVIDFKDIECRGRERFYPFLCMGSFVICATLCPILIGMVTYMVLFGMFTVLTYADKLAAWCDMLVKKGGDVVDRERA